MFVWNISHRKKKKIFFSKWKPSKTFFMLSFSFFFLLVKHFLKLICFLKRFIFYMWILCLNICVCTVCMPHACRSKKDQVPWVLSGCWEPNPCSLQEQVLLTTDFISSAPIRHILFTILLCFPKIFFLWYYHISLWVFLLNVKHIFVKLD